MKVTKALIQKYHDGHCTPEERAAVENWLLNDDVEEQASFSKETRNEIWDGVKQVLPSQRKPAKRITMTRWMQVAAALIFCVCTAAYLFYPGKEAGVAVPLTALASNINTDLFSIQFGNDGKASFDKNSSTVDFCGTIRITPKKDMQLSFKTICSNGGHKQKSISIREGQTYIALNYKSGGDSEMLVIDEDMLFELPPVIKNQLSDQFKI